MGLHFGILKNSALYMPHSVDLQTTTVQQALTQTSTGSVSPENGKGDIPDTMAPGV